MNNIHWHNNKYGGNKQAQGAKILSPGCVCIFNIAKSGPF